MQEKTQFFYSQSGSELGVVSCFLCSPRQWRPGAPQVGFQNLVFLPETERSHHLAERNNNNFHPPAPPLSLSLSATNIWQIFSSESSANRSLMPKDKTLMKTMWCKGYRDITGSRAPWESDWQQVRLLLGNHTVWTGLWSPCDRTEEPGLRVDLDVTTAWMFLMNVSQL